MAISKKQESSSTQNELEKIKKLLILQMYYQDDIPAELIAKAVGLNANSIRNMFPKEKIKGRAKPPIRQNKTQSRKKVNPKKPLKKIE